MSLNELVLISFWPMKIRIVYDKLMFWKTRNDDDLDIFHFIYRHHRTRQKIRFLARSLTVSYNSHRSNFRENTLIAFWIEQLSKKCIRFHFNWFVIVARYYNSFFFEWMHQYAIDIADKNVSCLKVSNCLSSFHSVG